MTSSTPLRNFDAEAKVLKFYNYLMNDAVTVQMYGYGDFCNYGYWDAGTKTAHDASVNLVQKLLDLIPDKTGTILDVACGQGATTRQILNYYPAENVTGINISDDQLARARINAPGVRFLNMDAAHLEFEDNSFDNVICVEAAFHFQTREAFMRETLRVLKPGGRLVISDILGWQPKATLANKLKNPAAYDALLASCGFENRQVIDSTKTSIKGFAHHSTHWARGERKAGRLSRKASTKHWISSRLYAAFMHHGHKYYVLGSGQKPA